MDSMYKKIAELSPEKRELLEMLLKEQGVELAKSVIVPQKRDKNQFPLSFSQQRLWFLYQFEPESPVYNIPAAVRLTGELSVEALELALNEIIRRHEVLRTTFASVEGQPVQVIMPQLTIQIPIQDLDPVEPTERENRALELILEQVQQPFNLATGPLLRPLLLRLAADEHIVLLTMHHIVSDGWATGLLIQEIAALYRAFLTRQKSPLRDLTIQYADYAVWQRQWLQGQELTRQLDYWKKQLVDSRTVLELATDNVRPAVQSYNGAFVTFTLDKSLMKSLQDLGHQEEATPFMTLLAAFNVLLHRYTGQEDINVGSPIANRNRAETEDLIGFFINTLVMRTDLSGNPGFRTLLRRVKEITLNALAHQDLPFELLVEELKLQRDMSHSPLFQVMFVLNNAPLGALDLAGLKMQPLEIDNGTAKFDLVLSMMERSDGLYGKLEYNTDLFQANTIERLAAHFEILLTGIVADPEQPISDLPLLTEVEKKRILQDWNIDSKRSPIRTCIHRLFEAQAERTPKAVAVVCGQQELSYRDLDEKANQLAHYLQKLGVQPEIPIGLCIERSLDLIVGILGILKAGGVYLPLDPEYPKERLAFMLEDARVPLLLTQKHLLNSLPIEERQVVCLDTDWDLIAQEPIDKAGSNVKPEHLVYVIYTSGSTGTPKGVQITHDVFVEHCQEIVRHFELDADDRVLQFSALNFDTSIEQIFPTLMVGAQVVLRDREVWTPAEFLQKVKDLKLTVVNPPTAYWQQLAQEWVNHPETALGHQLRLVIAGGDKMSTEAVRLWQQASMNSVRLLNAYGPTETTITATTFAVPPNYAQESRKAIVPIGRPLANRTAYVLDQQGKLVPVGVPGELYLGGVGIARGYLNRPDLTLKSFVPDPFSTTPGARLYKTGDLVRYLPDGNLEFLGRVDQQVKIRGFRIELDEIETILDQHPTIQKAVVMAFEDDHAAKRLVAYLVKKSGVDGTSTTDLRDYVKSKLPEFMVPSAFMVLDQFPMTPAGKLDRRALPTPSQAQRDLAAAYVPPRTPVEEMLAGMWTEVLKVDRVGIHDNFFDLGGHSLMATQLISRIRDAFNVELSLRRLFEDPTIAGLSLNIANSMAEQASPEDLDQMLAEIEQLSEDDLQNLLKEELESPK